MRFACILLICCLELNCLTAAEFSTEYIELSWPESGNFLAVVDSECTLGNLRIKAFDKQNRVVYSAPVDYVPPNATLLLPTGGDFEKGNKLYASGKPEELKLIGSVPNIIGLNFLGKLLNDTFEMQIQMNTFAESRFEMQMDFLSTGDIEVKPNTHGLELITDTVFMIIKKEKGDIKINTERNQNKHTITITGKGENIYKIKIGML